MIRKIVLYLFFFSVFLMVLDSCKKEVAEAADEPDVIVLRWNKSYPAETAEMVEAGLKWSLSFLGAELKKGSFDAATEWNGNQLTLDISKPGFTMEAVGIFHKIIAHLKASEEYSKMGGIDIGRFVMLTLNAVNHYYAITGAKRDLGSFKSKFVFDLKKVAIVESAISKSHRLIDIPQSTQLFQTAFMATEGTGSVIDHSFRIQEFEVLDLMPNGQFRFALYDTTGKLKPFADSTLSLAAKPAKCLWCHESGLQPPFYAQTNVPDYYTHQEFKSIITDRSKMIADYRASLSSDIDFTKKRDHAFAELLYIGFMEPNAERLAIEWNMTVNSIKQRLNGLQIHTNAEHPQLGVLYDRKEVDLKSPYLYIRVSDTAREQSEYEPNLVH